MTGFVGVARRLLVIVPAIIGVATLSYAQQNDAENTRRKYTIFFDYDAAQLSPMATQIVDAVAKTAKDSSVLFADVSGYNDTSPSAAHSSELSMHRAKLVAERLMADGVSESRISIKGYGEMPQAVPTKRGLREPENRRVEIVLRPGQD